MSLLEDKVILITGAARGIGFLTAQRFASEGARLILVDSGADLAGNGFDAELVEGAAATVRSMGPQVEAMGIAADISKEENVARVFEQALAQFGRIDCLVHAAGSVRDRSLFDMELEDFRSVVENKLTSAFLLTRAFARSAKKTKTGGSIIYFGGISGFLGNLGQANEASAQAGLYGLMRTASIELQKWGVRVNLVAPLAKTRLTEDLPIFEKVEGTMEPKHIAPVALFLASDLAAGLSGKVISAAGGRMSAFSLSESQGRMKDAEGGVWTAEELAENFESLSRL